MHTGRCIQLANKIMKHCKLFLLVGFTALYCLSLCASEQAEQQPYYLQVLASLQADTSIRPRVPNVHPVNTVYNREAIIPPQCYTRTEGEHNPCYVCHQNAIEGRENVMNDGALQVAYSFSDLGTRNHWQNLFEDRSEAVAKISDEEILEWVAEDNYSELADNLKKENFKGWIPDLKNLQKGAAAFDEFGFAKDGSHWVAFNYKPMPSTFWPTNGATDDVMIRLAPDYRSNKKGEYSLDIYRANLAIVEANLKGLKKITSLPVNEKSFDVDLNLDGKLGLITEILKVDSYVGAAQGYFITSHLYPKGTEFLHTVRYLGIDEKGEIGVSTRIKEVRYMRKWKAYDKPLYARKYELESFEKEAGNLPGYTYIGDHGLDNGNGWSIQGFIENRKGDLRISTFEENFFCMGCHNSIGSTIDKTFSFARKVDGAEGWGYINLKGMPDAPNRGESQGEILTYLQRVGGGGEFRSNPEMYDRWFTRDGQVDIALVNKAKDVYDLIVPSVARALQLNKAYRVIVDQQDYIFGRDATVNPPKNVYQEIDNESSPTLPADKIYTWDIRLDWQQNSNSSLATSEYLTLQKDN